LSKGERGRERERERERGRRGGGERREKGLSLKMNISELTAPQLFLPY